jgi:hypothetical protein
MTEQQSPAKVYLITQDTRDAILGYLFTRPYAEVAKGVDMLRELPEYSPPEVVLTKVPTLDLVGKE